MRQIDALTKLSQLFTHIKNLLHIGNKLMGSYACLYPLFWLSE